MEIQFLGAAQTVTGSKHLVTTRAETPACSSTAACSRATATNRSPATRTLGVEPASLDAVILSHAHIDHSGALPILVKRGYGGPIYTTPATRDLCAAMLMDAAFLQASDARYINHRIEREGAAMDRVEPLFDEQDVLRTLEQMMSIPYRHRHRVGARRRRSPSSTRGTCWAAPSRCSTSTRPATRSAWSTRATSAASASRSCATRSPRPARTPSSSRAPTATARTRRTRTWRRRWRRS